MHRETFWIMGGGLFGRLACERLQTAWPAARILVVDRREIDAPSGVEGVVSDARVFLDENMHPRSEAWIVPAVPVHLAYEWLADRLRRERDFMPHAIPQDLLPDLPNPCRGPEGQVYLTNADFRCPNDCPEPESTCTVTGRPRPLVMHRYLAALAFEAYTSIVLTSLQLAPGVGGYQATTLLATFDRMRQRNGQFLFSTACQCHAVMHAFDLA